MFVPGICLAQPIRTSSSLFRRSQRVSRVRRLLSLVESSSLAISGAGSVSSKWEITLLPKRQEMVRQHMRQEVELNQELENLLLLMVEGYGPLGYELNPVSTRRRYFCRPPRTRSKRTPARQRTDFPFQPPPLHSVVNSHSETHGISRQNVPSLIIPACRHLRKRQAWQAFLRRLVISHSFITGQLYSMLPRRQQTGSTP